MKKLNWLRMFAALVMIVMSWVDDRVDKIVNETMTPHELAYKVAFETAFETLHVTNDFKG